MPYKSNDELPEQIKGNLPEHAQEVWRETFNSAEKQYEDPEKRRDPSEDADTVAAKVAWDAVKDAGYHKDEKSGEWKKSE